MVARAQEVTPRAFSRAEYEQLATMGFFGEERVELIRGVIVRMATKGPTHEGVIARLNKLLVIALGDRATVRIQSAFAASDDSEPEPDVAVVPAAEDDLAAHPTSAFLLIEVADSTLAHDHAKAELYAECGVPEYWVVDLKHGLVEVHQDIVDGRYVRMTPCRPGDVLRPAAFPDVAVPVSRLVR